MATQTRSSANCVTATAGGAFFPDWVNASNAQTDDANYAYCAVSFGQFSEWFEASQFGFTIPAGSTIESVSIMARCSSHNGNDTLFLDFYPDALASTDGKLISGTTKATYNWTGDYQGELGWTVEDINSSGWTVRFGIYSSATIRIYYLEATVTYTPPPSGNSLLWHPF